jgi:hypothetical protein
LIFVSYADDPRPYAGRIDNHRGTPMKLNEGTVDRIVRVLVGIVLLGLTFTGAIGAWGYIGLVPLATGAVGMCPLYTLLGINTCKTS